jgi:DNA-binding PadR family transcriptional regulator
VPRQTNISPQTLKVLGALLRRREGWHYGYALSRETDLPSGTLYPILIRLAEQGWLDTRWTDPDRPGVPPRHTYRLTKVGAAAAVQRIEAHSDGRRVLRTRVART